MPTKIDTPGPVAHDSYNCILSASHLSDAKTLRPLHRRSLKYTVPYAKNSEMWGFMTSFEEYHVNFT